MKSSQQPPMVQAAQEQTTLAAALAYAALGKPARCGHCKSGVALPASPIEITDTEAFDAAVATSALPLIVDFWAPWCGPCRMVAPELERVARDTQGRYIVIKVNTDELQEIASRFRIRSIPTLAVLYQGREIQRVAGARTAQDIIAFVRESIAEAERRVS